MSKKIHFFRHEDLEFAWFPDVKRLIEVSVVEKKIIDQLLNCDLSIEQLVNSKEYIDIPLQEIKMIVMNIVKRLKDSPKAWMPYLVDIEITKRCNLSCKHCFQSTHKGQYMPYEVFARNLDILIDSGVSKIRIVGGEPFMHPEIWRILDLVSSRDIKTTLLTNATLLNDANIKLLSKISNLSINISIDGIKEDHEFIRGKGTYDIVIDNIKKLKSYSIPINVLCTINKKNVKHYDQLIDLCETLKTDCGFVLYKPSAHKSDWLIPYPDDVFSAWIGIYNKGKQSSRNVWITESPIESYLSDTCIQHECSACFDSITITSDNKLAPCPFVLSFEGNEGSLPEMDKEFILKFNNHPLIESFRENRECGCLARKLYFANFLKKEDPFSLSAFQDFCSH